MLYKKSTYLFTSELILGKSSFHHNIPCLEPSSGFWQQFIWPGSFPQGLSASHIAFYPSSWSTGFLYVPEHIKLFYCLRLLLLPLPGPLCPQIFVPWLLLLFKSYQISSVQPPDHPIWVSLRPTHSLPSAFHFYLKHLSLSALCFLVYCVSLNCCSVKAWTLPYPPPI